MEQSKSAAATDAGLPQLPIGTIAGSCALFLRRRPGDQDLSNATLTRSVARYQRVTSAESRIDDKA